jgi:hypothetical protein
MRTWTRVRDVTDGNWADTYDVEELWELTEPLGLEYCQLADLADAFHVKCWREGDDWVSPCDVVLNPSAYPEHAGLIETAKLTYPILVTATLVPLVIDGMHRLCSAQIKGWLSIPAKYVDSQLLEKALVCSTFHPKI